MGWKDPIANIMQPIGLPENGRSFIDLKRRLSAHVSVCSCAASVPEPIGLTTGVFDVD